MVHRRRIASKRHRPSNRHIRGHERQVIRGEIRRQTANPNFQFQRLGLLM